MHSSTSITDSTRAHPAGSRPAAGVLLMLLIALAPASSCPGAEETGVLPSGTDLRLFKTIEGVVRLFEIRAGEIWPGYSLAEQPFLVYSPDRWAILVNPGGPADGFGHMPGDWPGLGIDAVCHEGSYGGLSGQLKFNLSLAGESVAAIGFRDSFIERYGQLEYEAFSYIVHEAFHQYQQDFFGEIPWAREEKYPISDFNNGALAWLEMRVLKEVLEALRADDREKCRRKTETFVAVRRHRWENGDPYLREYEQGKELSEGTAKYVELKCVELLPGVDYLSAVDGAASPLAGLVPGEPMPGLLLRDLRGRMSGTCLQPEDIPRNRIYAVAAIQAFLLDHFGIAWKDLAREAGAGFTYADLLGGHLGIDKGRQEELLEEAKRDHDFETVLDATAQAARDYRLCYERELGEFEAQEGKRIEIVVSSSGLFRSRVSRGKKWLMDDGLFLLCSNFNTYTLQGADLSFELHDAGLLEINDWDERVKTLVLYDAGVNSISLNGGPAGAISQGTTGFESIELEGTRFVLKGMRQGSITAGKDKISIMLTRR